MVKERDRSSSIHGFQHSFHGLALENAQENPKKQLNPKKG
jgi:hypothetical protein